MAGSGTVPHEPIRVLIADSNQMNTQLLADAVARDRRFAVAGSAVNMTQLFCELNNHPQIAVVAIDLEKPLGGLAASRSLRDYEPSVRTVILVDAAERELVVEAFRSGARGVFGRSQPLETLWKCIYSVHNGEIWASKAETEFLLEALADSTLPHIVNTDGMSVLSGRELAVVRYVHEGLTNREIAQRMQRSEHTIKNHLFRIYRKLGLSSRLELTLAVGRQRPSSQAIFPDGGEVPKDDVGLFQWYSKQAEYSPFALYRIGEMYLEGRGVQKDEITGHICLASAEQTANEIASCSRAVREQHCQERFSHDDRITECFAVA